MNGLCPSQRAHGGHRVPTPRASGKRDEPGDLWGFPNWTSFAEACRLSWNSGLIGSPNWVHEDAPFIQLTRSPIRELRWSPPPLGQPQSGPHFLSGCWPRQHPLEDTSDARMYESFRFCILSS